jgi:hypothetical protein
MATIPTPTTTGGASALPAAGGTSESTISSWAGPYVTNMLGKAQAIANDPYQVYQGPMTAGQSNLQSKVFEGLGGLTFPGNLGGSFSSTGAYQPPQMNMDAYNTSPIGTGNAGTVGSASTPNAGGVGITSGQPASSTSTTTPNFAQQYMNPYLQSVLDPQLAELRRQNDITNMKANASMTTQGAFGGGRNAIMNAENNRNLMQEMNKTVGQGYANAYDKAMGQFNTEQGQSKDLVNMLANAGQAERGIEQEGITADYNEFLAQRDDPMKKTQYLQSMLQGLPYATTTNSPLGKSGIGKLSEIAAGMPELEQTLKDLGLLP